ncbi:MAG TPA: hypothetical protein VGS27_29115 [Candidatus Sulfotelmatobacter sp.]|nr:hypothetical protein [Candidatus Sulfotelmatobacter sp.]
MTQPKPTPPKTGFRWPVFLATVAIVVLLLLAIYFFVYLRVGA